MSRSKRKSFLRPFSLNKSSKSPTKDKVPSQEGEGPHNADSAPLPESPEDRYIPRQWAPNRLQTLYVTPSEQNLYLAAMAQLDQAPPPLPLWTDPIPQLPLVPQAPPIDPTPPSIISPVRRTVALPLSPNPKLVTSPGLPLQGLSIRDEFRSAPLKASQQHALLAFSDEAQLRFHNFPLTTLVAINEVLPDAWPRGIRSRHESLDDLGKEPQGQQQNITWIVVLKGKVWNRPGNAELDSIRLVLAVLTTLGIHGWHLVERVQAAGVKYDHHNLLFAYSPEVQAQPPTYFALSVPLPDRISLIAPPPKATPAIISSVREAIQSQSSSRRRTVGGGGSGQSVASVKGNGRVGWRDIRLEGWVHPGVYRFWMDGMRRWLGNGVKWGVVARLHPPLILSIINALSAQHFTLVTSLPLLPLVKGRDILIFASTADSGLTYRDTYRTNPSHAATEAPSRRDSIVLIRPEDAVVPRGEAVPREFAQTVGMAERLEAAGVMAEERRVATGAAGIQGFIGDAGGAGPVGIVNKSKPGTFVGVAEQQRRRRAASDTTSAQSRHIGNSPATYRSALPSNHESSESGHALTPANVSSPRRRNLLVKKNSLNRRGSRDCDVGGQRGADEGSRGLLRGGGGGSVGSRSSSLNRRERRYSGPRNAHGHGNGHKGVYPRGAEDTGGHAHGVLGSLMGLGSERKKDFHDPGHRRFASLDGRRPQQSHSGEPGPGAEGARLAGVNVTSRHGIGSDISVEPALEGWSLVDIPRQEGLGLSVYAPRGDAQPAADQGGIAGIGTGEDVEGRDIETRVPPPLPPRRPDNASDADSPTQHVHSRLPDPRLIPHQTPESGESIYLDAPTGAPGQSPIIPPSFIPPPQLPIHSGQYPQNPLNPSRHTNNSTDPGIDKYPTFPRHLQIANATPPPTSILQSQALQPTVLMQHGPALTDLDAQLVQPRSPHKGREGLVDVGGGVGIHSMAGSVGYLGGLGSQSMLGLTPAPSEMEIPPVPLVTDKALPPVPPVPTPVLVPAPAPVLHTQPAPTPDAAEAYTQTQLGQDPYAVGPDAQASYEGGSEMSMEGTPETVDRKGKGREVEVGSTIHGSARTRVSIIR